MCEKKYDQLKIWKRKKSARTMITSREQVILPLVIL